MAASVNTKTILLDFVLEIIISVSFFPHNSDNFPMFELDNARNTGIASVNGLGAEVFPHLDGVDPHYLPDFV